MNPMLPAKLASITLLAALLAPGLAWSKASDRNQPMTIDSNNNDCNFSDNGKCQFSGNVIITQGSMEIHADTADVIRKNGETERVTVVSRLDTFEDVRYFRSGGLLPQLLIESMKNASAN